MEPNYSSKVTFVSKEITAKERIKLKDMSNCVSLDAATTENDTLIITPAYYAEVSIHNEKSDDKDYKKYVVVDTAGTKYETGSESFIKSFKEIADDMATDAPGEEYSIEVFRRESKNYKGKTFITCSLV